MESGYFRPISFLNVDYRLFTPIMAKQLGVLLPKLIQNDQMCLYNNAKHKTIYRMLHIMDPIQAQHSRYQW